MMTQKPNRDLHRDGPLTFAAARYRPPMASLSLNVSPESLIAEAEEIERDAATEACLSENGTRAKFWRRAAALRAVAIVIAEHGGFFPEVCREIDLQRGQQ